MKRFKHGIRRLIYILGIVLIFNLYHVPSILAEAGSLSVLQDGNKQAISETLVMKENVKIYYEKQGDVGRTECKIDDMPYGISYSRPAQFELKLSDFNTTYHTLKFVTYSKEDKFVDTKEYLLKVVQKRQLPTRAHRKTKTFKVGQNPEYRRSYIPILMYHDVVSEVENESAQVSKNQLKAQLQALLNAGYTPINFLDYTQYKKGVQGLPKKPIIITFDDGYKSNYSNAFPILKNLNMEATYFVTTDVMGKVTTANEHFNWEEAKEMEKSGLIDIQSHTHTHPNMRRLSEQEVLIEITRSFEMIENHLGARDVKVMCYPEFKSTSKVRQQIYDLGVQLQVTDLANTNRLSNYPTQLRRIHVHNNLSGQDLVRQIKSLTL